MSLREKLRRITCFLQKAISNKLKTFLFNTKMNQILKRGLGKNSNADFTLHFKLKRVNIFFRVY